QEVEGATQLLYKVFVQAHDMELDWDLRKVPRGVLGKLLKERLQGCVSGSMAHAWLEADADVEGRDRVLGDFLRQVDVAISPGKAGGGYAYDGAVFADH